MKVGIIMKNSMVEKIMELNRKIESITMKTTSYFSFGEKQNLNNYDRQIIEFYQEILNFIIKNSNLTRRYKIYGDYYTYKNEYF